MPSRGGWRLERAHVRAHEPSLALADPHLGEVARRLVPQPLGMGLREPGPLGEVAGRGRSVEAEEAANGLARGRRPARLAHPCSGARSRAGRPPSPWRSATAWERRGGSGSPGTRASGRRGRAVLSSSCSSFLSSARPFASASFVAVATSSSASLGANPFSAARRWTCRPSCAAKLAVVAGDQGAPVEREVAGRERVDGPADDVGDDEVAGVDRVVVGLPGEALGPRRQRQQRRVAGEVRGGAGRRLGEPARVADGQPGAGQPEGENLIGVHVFRSPASDRRSACRRAPPCPSPVPGCPRQRPPRPGAARSGSGARRSGC